MRKLSKNNRGYSLVEMIIVVAIIAVVGLGATWSIILVLSGNAKTCTHSIMNAISECKITTMSQGKGNVRLLLYRDDDGNVYSEIQTRESKTADWVTAYNGLEKIGAKRCAVGSAKDADDLPKKDSAWEIYFDRSSGSFLYDVDKGGVTSVENIYVMGGRRNYHIRLEKLTGKQILE